MAGSAKAGRRVTAGEHVVTLDPTECARAALIGSGRVLRNRRDGTQHSNGGKRDAYRDLGRDIESVGAEMAFAKWIGRYYEPTTRPDDGTDVAGIQVRSTPVPHGALLLHEKDTGPCVLVTGELPTFTMRGWITAEAAKTPAHWRDGARPCYWVDQGELLLLDTLREWMRAAA